MGHKKQTKGFRVLLETIEYALDDFFQDICGRWFILI